MAISVPPHRLASPTIRAAIGRRLAGLGSLLLLAAGAVVLVSLASYDLRDPSLNTATAGAAHNLAGPPGAMLADMLLQGLGLAAVLPGLALLAWAWRLGIARGGGSALLRVATLLATMPALAATLSGGAILLGRNVPWPTHAGLGGAIGQMLAQNALMIGHDILGASGGAIMVALCSLSALILTVLTLGLTAGEWRAAGRSAGQVATGSRQAAGVLQRSAARVADTGTWALNRINGVGPVTDRDSVRGGLIEPVPVSVGRAIPHDEDDDEIQMPIQLPPATQHAARSAPVPRAAPARKATVPAKQEVMPLEGTWRFPPLSLLTRAPSRATSGQPSEEALLANGRLLESVLADYGVQGRIVGHKPGPVVTLYELEPAPGIRSARVIGLADDVARSLSVTAVRIATVPGRNVIGIEVPNSRRETVFLSELLEVEDWEKSQGRLTLALGKDIGGKAIMADLARMPHLLVAGTTGSGKSVGINAMILSILYRLSPDQCRLILIDPKMLELSVYEGIPHLMTPVVTEPAKAVVALKWTVREMERRYRAMSQLSVRNIGGYNERVAEAKSRGEVVNRRVQTGFDSETGKPIFEDQNLALEPLPFIVVIIDEMADLMMVAGKEIEAAVQRLAQMARAAGIHVVMATQRPSVDVITGTIKANFPTRISFTVISKFDSRTILGEQGSEQLLGQGDMLYMAGGGRITRVHGPFVSDKEVEDVVAFLREQGEPNYVEEVTEAPPENEASTSGISGASEGEKGLFDQAVDVVAREGKASTSFIQRHLQIGYNRAARLIEQMEKEGIVGPANHVGKREVLVRRTNED